MSWPTPPTTPALAAAWLSALAVPACPSRGSARWQFRLISQLVCAVARQGGTAHDVLGALRDGPDAVLSLVATLPDLTPLLRRALAVAARSPHGHAVTRHWHAQLARAMRDPLATAAANHAVRECADFEAAAQELSLPEHFAAISSREDAWWWLRRRRAAHLNTTRQFTPLLRGPIPDSLLVDAVWATAGRGRSAHDLLAVLRSGPEATLTLARGADTLPPRRRELTALRRWSRPRFALSCRAPAFCRAWAALVAWDLAAPAAPDA
jgi:hypothetical protein